MPPLRGSCERENCVGSVGEAGGVEGVRSNLDGIFIIYIINEC